jgi:hypothetical protein
MNAFETIFAKTPTYCKTTHFSLRHFFIHSYTYSIVTGKTFEY